MSDTADPPDRHKDSRGVQAYRWIVMAVLAVNGALLMGVLNKIDKTAELAGALQNIVSGLNSRIDAHKDRLADHDKAIYRLEDRVFVRGNP